MHCFLNISKTPKDWEMRFSLILYTLSYYYTSIIVCHLTIWSKLLKLFTVGKSLTSKRPGNYLKKSTQFFIRILHLRPNQNKVWVILETNTSLPHLSLFDMLVKIALHKKKILLLCSFQWTFFRYMLVCHFLRIVVFIP